MISVVIPYFNEALCIEPLLRRIHQTFQKIGIEDYEVVIVDNGSFPEQHQTLRRLCTGAKERIIVLSRNFGYQGALWAGL